MPLPLINRPSSTWYQTVKKFYLTAVLVCNSQASTCLLAFQITSSVNCWSVSSAYFSLSTGSFVFFRGSVGILYVFWRATVCLNYENTFSQRVSCLLTCLWFLLFHSGFFPHVIKFGNVFFYVLCIFSFFLRNLSLTLNS